MKNFKDFAGVITNFSVVGLNVHRDSERIAVPVGEDVFANLVACGYKGHCEEEVFIACDPDTGGPTLHRHYTVVVPYIDPCDEEFWEC